MSMFGTKTITNDDSAKKEENENSFTSATNFLKI
jgi:hypothetical protein